MQAISSFTPTDRQIRAAENLFLSMADEECVRPVVEAYQAEILARHQFHIDQRWIVEMSMPDRIILHPKDSYLLSKEDWFAYDKECKQAAASANLRVSNPNNCPLLEAMTIRTEAENALFYAMSQIPRLEHLSRAHLLTADARRRAIDLCLNLLAPFVADVPAILERVAAD